MLTYNLVCLVALFDQNCIINSIQSPKSSTVDLPIFQLCADGQIPASYCNIIPSTIKPVSTVYRMHANMHANMHFYVIKTFIWPILGLCSCIIMLQPARCWHQWSSLSVTAPHWKEGWRKKLHLIFIIKGCCLQAAIINKTFTTFFLHHQKYHYCKLLWNTVI